MDEKHQIALVEEARRRGFNVDRIDLTDTLFDKQRALLRDPHRRKCGMCGRRSGKTTAVTRGVTQTALDNPRSKTVYMARTRDGAKKLVWGELKLLNIRYKLGCEFRETELRMVFPNRAEIWLCGADKEADIEKLRGHAFHMVVVDEAQSFGKHLESLIEEVLGPALADHRGTLILIGTPNATKTGYFHEATEGKRAWAWNTHRWTVLDNPMYPEFVRWRKENPGKEDEWEKYARVWLKEYREENGWSPNNPKYQREWLGRWVVDADNRVYHRFDSELNGLSGMPDGEYLHVLGIDFGYEDATAFVDASFSKHDPRVYFNRSVKRANMIISDIVDEIQRRMRDRKYMRIVADCAGPGKMIAMEISKRHGIPVKPAEKRDKHGAIELLNSDFHEGKAMVVDAPDLCEELAVLQWSSGRKDQENPSQDNHLCDAMLYAYKECFHYASSPAPEKPKPGSQEAMDEEVRRMDEENMRLVDPLEDFYGEDEAVVW